MKPRVNSVPGQWKVNDKAKKYQACATELSTEQSSEVLLTITRECLGLSGGLGLLSGVSWLIKWRSPPGRLVSWLKS